MVRRSASRRSKGNEHLDMLYVHPAAIGQGAATMLVRCDGKTGAARGAMKLKVDASDTAHDFFKQRGYAPQKPQHGDTRRRMARQHHNGKAAWCKPETPGEGNTPMTPFPRHSHYYIAHRRHRWSLSRWRSNVLESLVRSWPRERLYLFDTTLRDGAQTNGVDFTLNDKLVLIAKMLDDLGIDYVEGGYPGANPTDTEFFAQDRNLNSDLHGIRHDAPARPIDLQRSGSRDACSKPRRTRSASLPNPQTIRCGSRSRPRSMRTSPRSATASRPRRRKGREVLVDCEHFFDGYKANPHYALSPAPRRPMTPARAGSCCATPMAARCRMRSRQIVSAVTKVIPGDHVGIHAHNDTEQAVANSLAAVRAGARQIQGTLNGLGERCGNANLVSIIPTLKLKPEFSRSVRHQCLGRAVARRWPHASRKLDDMLNRAPEPSRALCRRQARLPPRPAFMPRRS